jgi:hypothetical protein
MIDHEADPIKWKSPIKAEACQFSICRALTEEYRLQLLAVLRLIRRIWSSAIIACNTQYIFMPIISVKILHHSILLPSPEDSSNIAAFYGETAPVELTWAIISSGWMLCPSETEQEVRAVCQIQHVLRRFVINVCLNTRLRETDDLTGNSIRISHSPHLYC